MANPITVDSTLTVELDHGDTCVAIEIEVEHEWFHDYDGKWHYQGSIITSAPDWVFDLPLSKVLNEVERNHFDKLRKDLESYAD